MVKTPKYRINFLWQQATPIQGKNPNLWRKDHLGSIIYKPAFGTCGRYGWETDHRRPKNKGGKNRKHNIQPLHWKTNRQKSNQYPHHYKAANRT